MKQEFIFIKAIESVASEGIKIRRGACFDWTQYIQGSPTPIKTNTPTSVNATGAVLWFNKREECIGQANELKLLCNLLDVDTWWLYRFWMGFDRNFLIQIMDDDNKIIGQDEISKLGISLAKKYVKKNYLKNYSW